MTIDKCASTLKDFGVRSDCPEWLELLPIIFVAWADGPLTEAKVDRIRRLAWIHGLTSTSPPIERWLATPPSRLDVARGCATLHQLALASDDTSVDFDGLCRMLARAEWVARTTAGSCDAPWAMTASAEHALRDVTKWLGVSLGDTWTALWHELDGSVAA